MRLLLDENVGSANWSRHLVQCGHDVVRAVDVGLQGVDDADLLEYAHREARAIVTRDKAKDEPDDLVALWEKLPEPRPLVLLIYTGAVITAEDVARAIDNLNDAGVAENALCPVNQWKFQVP